MCQPEGGKASRRPGSPRVGCKMGVVLRGEHTGGGHRDGGGGQVLRIQVPLAACPFS